MIFRKWFLCLMLTTALPTLQAAETTTTESQTITVAAASDLKFALEELAVVFEKDTGHRLQLVFGSSGQLSMQIAQGAPFQVFMSADEKLVDQLADAGKTQGRGRPYAMGRIALFIPNGSPLKLDGQLLDLKAAAQDGRLQKLAIANPEHAPYGARAQEALQRAGIWKEVKDKLVLGENVSQAAQFASSGAAQAGIIAYSLALSPAMATLGHYVMIPADWHQPLRQRMVVLRNAPTAANAFDAYMRSVKAQSIMSRHGFVVPRN